MAPQAPPQNPPRKTAGGTDEASLAGVLFDEMSPGAPPPVPQVKTVAGQVTSNTVSSTHKKREKPLTAAEQARIEKVKKIMFDLAKTVRSFTVYNQNNEAIRQFIQSLFDAITQFLETENMDLALRFRVETIEFNEEVVYENSNPEESIAVKLYKDGVKEVIFQSGLEKKELVDFIDILNINLDAPEYFDSDIVSLLWERNFDHVSYVVIEGFVDYLDPKKLKEVKSDIALILSLVHSDKPSDRAVRSAHLSKEDLYQFFKQDILDEKAADAAGAEAYKKLFYVSEEEVRRIREQVEAVTDTDLVTQMVEVILNILATEHDEKSFNLIGDVLVQITDMLLLRSDFFTVTRIIKGLRDIGSGANKPRTAEAENMVIQRNYDHGEIAAAPGSKKDLTQWIEAIVKNIGQEQRLEQIVIAFNQGFKGKPADIFDFLVSLNSAAVVPLVNLLGDIGNLTHRRLICDAILVIQDGDITPFAQKLYDERWFVVSDMLYILGKLGSSDAVAYMKRTAQHESPKVRLEALGALKRFPIEKVRDVFIEALRDENLQVQLAAIRTLAHFKDHTAVDQIIATIESSDFMNFPISVKKRFCMALATIEKDAMLPFFERMLRRNRFWLGNTNTELRMCAAYGLGFIGSPEAQDILRKFTHAFSPKLREAAREALHRGKSVRDTSGELLLEPLRSDEIQTVRDMKRPAHALILEPINRKDLH